MSKQTKPWKTKPTLLKPGAATADLNTAIITRTANSGRQPKTTYERVDEPTAVT